MKRTNANHRRNAAIVKGVMLYVKYFLKDRTLMHSFWVSFMYLSMSDPRVEQRHYVERVLSTLGISGTAFAKKAKVAQTTITDILNDDHEFALSARTIAKIEAASGIPFTAEKSAGFHEAEAAPYIHATGSDDALQHAVKGLVSGKNALTPWTLRSRALEALGYLPGDVLIVDLNATADPGDIVCAQLYDWRHDAAETIFRKWEPPYLIAATGNPDLLAPYAVDNRNVVIKGVVVTSLRPRQHRIS